MFSKSRSRSWKREWQTRDKHTQTQPLKTKRYAYLETSCFYLIWNEILERKIISNVSVMYQLKCPGTPLCWRTNRIRYFHCTSNGSSTEANFPKARKLTYVYVVGEWLGTVVKALGSGLKGCGFENRIGQQPSSAHLRYVCWRAHVKNQRQRENIVLERTIYGNMSINIPNPFEQNCFVYYMTGKCGHCDRLV